MNIVLKAMFFINQKKMSIKILSASLLGIEAEIIEVEASTGGGDFGHITIVGLPDVSISEAKERVRSAFLNGRLEFPKRKITVNLAPAHIRKNGSNFDLPIAISILSLKYKFLIDFSTAFFVGELSLNGEIRKITGIVPMIIKAKEKKLKNIFVPLENAQEAGFIPDIKIYPVSSLSQLIDHLNKKKEIKPFQTKTYFQTIKIEQNFADIKGQAIAKRALEIAIAGGHNILLSGPPGSGKTLLAKAAIGILPSLSLSERIEISKIYSAAGNQYPISGRPFRSPHHTASAAALIGSARFRPGEISLAHLGVLFLDEFPEFSRDAIESLRQPLEEGQIMINRAVGNMTLPARFTLIAAMNSCPCGLKGIKGNNCNCSPEKIKKYNRKISGPIIDRIDLHVEVLGLDLLQLNNPNPSEDSDSVRQRVEESRVIQNQRLKNLIYPALNSYIPSKKIKNFCNLNQSCENLLLSAFQRLNFSNRSYFKILRIARTIADLDKSDCVLEKHLAEALQYRPKIE